MNDKDKEAFEKWISSLDWLFCSPTIKSSVIIDMKTSWQAACEYKQQEIEELKKQIYVKGSIYEQGSIKREMTWKESSDMMDRIVESRTKRLEQLQAENSKLKKFISALGYDQVVDDVIESLKKMEYK